MSTPTNPEAEEEPAHHQEAVVRRQSGGDRRDHEQDQVEDEHLVPTQAVDQWPTHQCAHQSAESHHRGEQSDLDGAETPLFGQASDTEAEAGEVVRIDEHTAERDDRQQSGPAGAGRVVVDEVDDVPGRTDDDRR